MAAPVRGSGGRTSKQTTCRSSIANKGPSTAELASVGPSWIVEPSGDSGKAKLPATAVSTKRLLT